MNHAATVTVPCHLLRRVLDAADLHCDDSEEIRLIGAADAAEYQAQRQGIAILRAILELADPEHGDE